MSKSNLIKYLVFCFLFTALLIVIDWQLTPPVTKETDQVGRYTDTLEADRSTPDDAVIYLGDSLTQFYANPSGTYNFGIGGDTTIGLVTRLRQYRSVKTARLVYLTIGTNDAARYKISVFENNLPLILELIPGKLIWRSIPPIDSNIKTQRSNEKIRLMNEMIRQACGQKPNCEYVDLTEKFADSAGNLKQEYHTGDGIHLSPEGYRIWDN